MSGNPTIYGYGVPTGSKLGGKQDEPGVLGTIRTNGPATKERLAVARANFVEMRERDFRTSRGSLAGGGRVLPRDAGPRRA